MVFPSSDPTSPILIAVPHAGRTYPDAMRALSRLDANALRPLEDRFADHLANGAARAGHGVMICDVARAWIDMNRAEDELDPALVAKPHGDSVFRTSLKARGGLGVVPSRIQTHGAIWRGPLRLEDIAARIAAHHRPWHDAIAAALAARHARFGLAILIDLHSMPPIRDWRTPDRTPRIIIGDLHGKSAHGDLVAAVMQILAESGMPASRNHPYAGGHTLARHGQPSRGVHAVQIEVDRALYLDAARDQPGKGLPAMQALIARLADGLAAQALPLSIAAE